LLQIERDTDGEEKIDELDVEHIGFIPDIELSEVTFRYSENSRPVLNNLNLSIKVGESVAIVGPSGAGKTTLVDVLLGVLEPEKGTVIISGKTPEETIRTWPGAISYVPQDVLIINGTIKANVSMGFPVEKVSDSAIWSALSVAQLDKVVSELESGLETQVGDRGTRLSGGQRQRLGIARAMYTAPKLIVLDEATSSLDGQTESDLAEALHLLKGKVTVVMIAHRLSSVRKVDKVIYLENGAVRSSGTFEQVRLEVTNFDQQANLMGL
jgi:ABC-type multidrug transport system fused ATPase/permease subunit